MENKCSVCDGNRIITKNYRQYLCPDCQGSGWDFSKYRKTIAPMVSEYAITTALPKMKSETSLVKRGRPRKNG